MKVYYKSPADNKVYSGSYDDLINNESLWYFYVKFHLKYADAKKEKDIK